MKTKNILFIYPHNFFKKDSGVNQRFFRFYEYFVSRNWTIDIIATKNFHSEWSENDIHEIEQNTRVRNLWVTNHLDKRGRRVWKQVVNGFLTNTRALPDYCSDDLFSIYRKAISEQQYDYVLWGYLYWGALLKRFKPSNTKCVIDVSDFITLQEYIENNIKFEQIGRAFMEELKRIRLFDKAMFISKHEYDLFMPFLSNLPGFFVPMFFESKPAIQGKYTYDLLYIGDDNNHNIKGFQWFSDKVLDRLPSDIKILVVGKMARVIPDDPRVEKRPYVENLDEPYATSKISICPILTGSGMKIKVVEALNYGKPVVGTKLAASGFVSKENNGVIIADEPALFASAITRLLRDKNHYLSVSTEAKAYFEKHFSTSVWVKTLDMVFSQI